MHLALCENVQHSRFEKTLKVWQTKSPNLSMPGEAPGT